MVTTKFARKMAPAYFPYSSVLSSSTFQYIAFGEVSETFDISISFMRPSNILIFCFRSSFGIEASKHGTFSNTTAQSTFSHSLVCTDKPNVDRHNTWTGQTHCRRRRIRQIEGGRLADEMTCSAWMLRVVSGVPYMGKIKIYMKPVQQMKRKTMTYTIRVYTIHNFFNFHVNPCSSRV